MVLFLSCSLWWLVIFPILPHDGQHAFPREHGRKLLEGYGFPVVEPDGSPNGAGGILGHEWSVHRLSLHGSRFTASLMLYYFGLPPGASPVHPKK